MTELQHPNAPGILRLEDIADGDMIRVEVSGDYAETWAPYIVNMGTGDRDVSLMQGSMARALIDRTAREHHGRLEYGPGRLVIRGTLLNESYSRHAWRFTRTPAVTKEPSK
ncbi:hypothetical protein OG497_37895 [Streptomyces sp. NBC_01242]|uniref:hypothetical protein n=1 Tax=Streptomyces sp. NBC_01242 TaxID=2903795 RepID=UPI0022597500|nr:hypothetical protein [Streptomyces sp. NBC_01242]MCX4799632.1 hypothetical protein [Streptomyces sp. NBC_01242]